MSTTQRVVGPLRFLLALAFLAMVVAQVGVLPWVWGRVVDGAPELAYLRWPTLVVAVLELGCAQVVVVCTWKLLGLVQRDRIFGEAAFVWVDGILRAMGAGWLLLVGTTVWVALTWGGPGLPVALLVLLLAGAVVGLLMVVMRALLAKATALQTDMEGVI